MLAFFQCAKMQISCLLILLFLSHNLFCEEKRLGKITIYHILHHAAVVAVLFDGISAYTVNNIHCVGNSVNTVVHLVFFVSLDLFLFLLYIYLYVKIAGVAKHKCKIYVPALIELVGLILVVTRIGKLEFRSGKYTDYSMGVPVYISFFLAALFFYGCLVLLLVFSRHVEKKKRLALISCLGFPAVMTVVQGFSPELLSTSLSVVIAVVGVYIHLENPAIKNLEKYHNEMVMGFATLVENRDAMPLDKCFEIIEQGSGTDFDPEIVKVFIEARPKVEEIYNRLK